MTQMPRPHHGPPSSPPSPDPDKATRNAENRSNLRGTDSRINTPAAEAARRREGAKVAGAAPYDPTSTPKDTPVDLPGKGPTAPSEGGAIPNLADADDLKVQQRFVDDADKVDDGLTELDNRVGEIANKEGRAEARESITALKDEIAALRRKVGRLVGDAEARDQVTAEMATRMGLFQEQLGDLRTTFEASRRARAQAETEKPPTAEEDAVSSLFDRLAKRIGKMFRELWRLVSSLTKPTEWTLKLKAGIADVEIKFGRQSTGGEALQDGS